MRDNVPTLLMRCTAKLLREMEAVGEDVELDGPEGSWYANLLRIERRKCVLFTHSETLFSVFVPCVRKSDLQALSFVLVSHLSAVMAAECLEKWAAENVLRMRRGYRVARTKSRSVLGSMNDFAFQVEIATEMCGGITKCDPVALSQQLNRTPMSGIGSKYPVDAFREWSSRENSADDRNC